MKKSNRSFAEQEKKVPMTHALHTSQDGEKDEGRREKAVSNSSEAVIYIEEHSHGGKADRRKDYKR